MTRWSPSRKAVEAAWWIHHKMLSALSGRPEAGFKAMRHALIAADMVDHPIRHKRTCLSVICDRKHDVLECGGPKYGCRCTCNVKPPTRRRR